MESQQSRLLMCLASSHQDLDEAPDSCGPAGPLALGHYFRLTKNQPTGAASPYKLLPKVLAARSYVHCAAASDLVAGLPQCQASWQASWRLGRDPRPRSPARPQRPFSRSKHLARRRAPWPRSAQPWALRFWGNSGPTLGGLGPSSAWHTA
jgi:hypothetical protein